MVIVRLLKLRLLKKRLQQVEARIVELEYKLKELENVS
jgi:hypothetical protein